MQMIRHASPASRRRRGGFTLIELMIAVAIVGILVTVAYPAYTQSVLKSHRAEAKAALLDLATREERYFAATNQYTSTATSLGYASGTTLTSAAPLPVMTGNSAYYNLSIVVPDPAAPTASPSFLATATAVNTQTSDTKCGNFVLSQSGLQTVTNATDSAANCW